jgi:ribose 5-phosphate isomerase B
LRVVLGADHRGYQLKDFLAAHIRGRGHEVIDAGTNSSDSVDYPDLAVKVARAIQDGEAERGILVCGSGVGACIAANKLDGIRAGLTHDTYSAHQGVEHDDMNVICMGSRIIGEELALEIVDAFLGANFIPEERYKRRLDKVRALEKSAREPDAPATAEGAIT